MTTARSGSGGCCCCCCIDEEEEEEEDNKDDDGSSLILVEGDADGVVVFDGGRRLLLLLVMSSPSPVAVVDSSTDDADAAAADFFLAMNLFHMPPLKLKRCPRAPDRWRFPEIVSEIDNTYGIDLAWRRRRRGFGFLIEWNCCLLFVATKLLSFSIFLYHSTIVDTLSCSRHFGKDLAGD